ncbi:MAG: MFS transporter [Gemmatales bacterium]|nr:MFS transporter [Gemmatales bacterium]MDW8386836.1 MFS transporter [Gemmatales bacterium]
MASQRFGSSGPSLGQSPTQVRHAVVALATLMSLFLYLDRICLAITLRAMQLDLGLTDVQASWLLSAFFWSYALAQVPAGWLADRFGARTMLSLYIFFWSLFTGLMGLTASFLLLMLYRLGCGLAQAGAYPTSGNLLSKWVPVRSRAFASSLVANGGRIGGVLAPSLTAYLMVLFDPADERGWRPALLTYGLLGIGVAWLFWRVVRDEPSRHPAVNDAELELIQGGRQTDSARTPVDRLLVAILANRSLWCSAVSQFGTNFAWVFLITWMPRFLEEVYGSDLLERGWYSSQPLLWGMLGMFAGGLLTDWLSRRLGLRWGRRLPMSLSRFLGAAAFFACPWMPNAQMATVMLCLVAVATDLGVPAVWAFKQDVGGRYVGAVLGWGNMWGNLGAAVSPLVLNYVISKLGWQEAFWTCAAGFIVAGLTALGVDARSKILPESSTP